MKNLYSKKLTKHIVIQVVVFILLIVADQITKLLVVNLLKGHENVPIIKDIIEFQYLENNGAAFGIFQNKQWLFYIITAVVIIVVVFLWFNLIRKLRNYSIKESVKVKTFNNIIFLNYIFPVLAAGAIGNLIDRVAHQYVVDFIYFKFINFPIFNFADICVTLSAVALVVFFIFIYKEDEDFGGLIK